MIQYDLNLLRNLFQDLHCLIKATISFYDNDFNATSVHSKCSVSDLCSYLKDDLKMGHKCAVSDEECFKRFRNGEDAFYYSCHMGLTEMAFRFAPNKVTYGYIIIGPFKNSTNAQETIRHIQTVCNQYNTELTKKAITLYQRLPSFSLEKYYAIKSIVFALCDYAKNQNLIFDKNNLFSETIEPYILEHLHEQLSLEKLCKTFFVSQKQLYALFKRNTQKTPKHYINEQRVNKARQLLVTTSMSLSDIAAAVGTLDYNYFIKIFKAYDGHTPSYYRK